MKVKDANRIADFVWARLLGLDAEETAGCDHMDWNGFNEWLLINIVASGESDAKQNTK